MDQNIDHHMSLEDYAELLKLRQTNTQLYLQLEIYKTELSIVQAENAKLVKALDGSGPEREKELTDLLISKEEELTTLRKRLIAIQSEFYGK